MYQSKVTHNIVLLSALMLDTYRHFAAGDNLHCLLWHNERKDTCVCGAGLDYDAVTMIFKGQWSIAVHFHINFLILCVHQVHCLMPFIFLPIFLESNLLL